MGTALAVANGWPVPNHLELVRQAAETLRASENVVDVARGQLHRRIVDADKAGESKSAIARSAGVSRQWVGKILGST
jgi:hypothetical protein